MERKRKLPARAAARVEHAAKKRTGTPPEHRSVTPAPAPPPVEEPPPPLPKSLQPGKPLPTVEDAQPDDLPMTDYQSVQESGVMSESLVRSKQAWIGESMFEKYWTKPVKKRGILKEPPNNPPKDSMAKLGQVTIAVGPQAFVATMFAVKDPKPPPPPLTAFRPIIQYGPSTGPTPSPSAATPSTPTAAPPAAAATDAAKPTPPATVKPSPAPQPEAVQPKASTPAPAEPPKPAENSVPPAAAPPSGPAQAIASTSTQQPSTPSNPPAQLPPTGAATSRPTTSSSSATTTAAKPAPAGAPAKPSGTDPIIVSLAERASEDSLLRDLMKRVAVGDANAQELAHFQKIIDEITREYKQKGGQQGPSADRLLVDGRTVKFFADEVRTILDIILRSNPNEKGSTLRPPEGIDSLVLALVKLGLDDLKTRDLIRRVSEGKPGFNDATDLKEILDKLHKALKTAPKPTPPPSLPATTAAAPVANGANGHSASPGGSTSGHQALRSKGPPPAPKPDINAVVFEFAAGGGDRFLFPKFSILEFLPTNGQQPQVVASFVIVRKGSVSEYGCDPTLDYYERITVRIIATDGRPLDALAKVVAPPDEVRKYMDEIMTSATRAEYILLAMRLPRAGKEGESPDGPTTAAEEANTATNGSTPKLEGTPGASGPSAGGASTPMQRQSSQQNPGVLWGPKTRSPSPARGGARKPRISSGKETNGVPSLKPKYSTRETSPPVFSLRKGLNGYSDADADRYTKMTQALAQKETESS